MKPDFGPIAAAVDVTYTVPIARGLDVPGETVKNSSMYTGSQTDGGGTQCRPATFPNDNSTLNDI